MKMKDETSWLRLMKNEFCDVIHARTTLGIVSFFIFLQALFYLTSLITPLELAGFQHVLGLSASDFFKGCFWQALTYSSIHADLSHLLINGLGILLFGKKIEAYLDCKTIFTLTFFAVLGGGICFLLSSFINRDSSVLIGSSAVFFAYIIVHTSLSPTSKFFPFFVTGKSLGRGIFLSCILLMIIHPDSPIDLCAKLGQTLANKISPNLYKISHSCHLGGALAGYILINFFIYPQVTARSLTKQRLKRENQTKHL